MTPPETPGDEPRWGERRRTSSQPPPGDGERTERPRTLEDDLADFYADFAGGARGDDREYGAPPPPPRSAVDFSALFVLLDVLRRAAPSELQDRVAALIREALLTLRSLIDWYLDRLDNPSREPRFEDIPIE